MEIEIQIKAVCANEKQHLDISSLLKTIVHTLDFAIEQKHPGNNLTFTIKGDHPDSVTSTPDKNQLTKHFGL